MGESPVPEVTPEDMIEIMCACGYNETEIFYAVDFVHLYNPYKKMREELHASKLLPENSFFKIQQWRDQTHDAWVCTVIDPYREQARLESLEIRRKARQQRRELLKACGGIASTGKR